MKYLFLFLSLTFFIYSCKSGGHSYKGYVLVKGGYAKNAKSNLYNSAVHIKDFYIGKYEVTQKEWTEVMGTNPSFFKGDSLPVDNVNWYESVEFCNKKSLREGLEPFYIIVKNRKDTFNHSEFDTLKFSVSFNKNANGYRLPTETEWEYAASGGQSSLNYSYSGSENIDSVAWFWRNSGDSLLKGTWSWADLERNHSSTKKVGSKKANELGIFDMSGNVREWCEDWYQDYQTKAGLLRSQRGGGWMGAENRCEIANRHHFDPTGKGADQGLRICRNAIE